MSPNGQRIVLPDGRSAQSGSQPRVPIIEVPVAVKFDDGTVKRVPQTINLMQVRRYRPAAKDPESKLTHTEVVYHNGDREVAACSYVRFQALAQAVGFNPAAFQDLSYPDAEWPAGERRTQNQ